MFEVIDAVRNATRDDFQIGIRLSVDRHGLRVEEIRDVMRRQQIDYIDLALWDSAQRVESGPDTARKMLELFTSLPRNGRPFPRKPGSSLRENADAIAELEALSAGRLIRDTAGEAVRVAEMFEYYAGWCDKLQGELIPVPPTHLNYTRQEPKRRGRPDHAMECPAVYCRLADRPCHLRGQRHDPQVVRADSAQLARPRCSL